MPDAAESAQNHPQLPRYQWRVEGASAGRCNITRLATSLEKKTFYISAHLSVASFSFTHTVLASFFLSHWLQDTSMLPNNIVAPLATYKSPRWSTCMKHQRITEGWNLQSPIKGPQGMQ